MRFIVRLRRGELRCLDRRSSRATTRRRANRTPPVRQPASPVGWRTRRPTVTQVQGNSLGFECSSFDQCQDGRAMAGPPDRTAAAGRPAALLIRVLGTRLRYQATRKGGTNKISDLQQHEPSPLRRRRPWTDARRCPGRRWRICLFMLDGASIQTGPDGGRTIALMIIGMIQGFPTANRKARRATWPDGKRRACPRR